MARTAAQRKEAPNSTAQQLGSIVKSSRDIMRKDKRSRKNKYYAVVVSLS
jgi:hypothetical protein